MKSNIEQPWIEAGYELFSKEGPGALKVDQMARRVGVSRSSFYHLFADLDVFQEKLLTYHLSRAQRAAQKVKMCKTMDPDFLLLIMDEKDYVLFNRQLRIHRHNPTFKAGFETAIGLVGKETMGIFTEMLDLQHKPAIARSVFQITADTLFHRMTEENINYEWLKSFLLEIKLLVKNMNGKP
ncbi:MAG: regulatory protein TetR [Bacteroidota bacterium]|nr:regulatory protein TetR [Bacteroidota bacterium]